MTFNSFGLILRRQFTQKWGRFLLASGGIMIGIWAITLTSSLSFGLSDTIVTAINSQPSAREIQVYKLENGQLFDFSKPPVFIPQRLSEIREIKDKYPHVDDVVPTSIFLNTFIKAKGVSAKLDCTAESGKVKAQQTKLQDEIAANPSKSEENLKKVEQLETDFSKNCLNLNISSNSFKSFYSNNKNKWFGSKDEPKKNEIAICFKCGQIDLNTKLGIKEPENLLNKEISLQISEAPSAYKAGESFDVLKGRPARAIPNTKAERFKIVAVVDDRETGNVFGGFTPIAYLNFDYFQGSIEKSKLNFDKKDIGYIEFTVIADSYENVDGLIKSMENDKYATFATTQILINSVKTAFTVITIVLAIFGLIALIASVFGIINVMTISVLERQKEIGILKSLGAKDGDIFWLFLLESASLGALGWLFGTLLSVACGYLISTVFNSLVNSNADWKNNLDTLNISGFSPSFPLWLLLSTLVLSLVFTILSGIFPALKASRQNPVEVLRSE